MKANELMLGDWVYDTILKGNTRVETLSLSGIKGDFHENVWDESTFEPIPLTPEILEKNFTRTEVRVLVGTKTHYIENDDFFDVALNEYTDSIWEFEYTNCESNFPIVRMFVTHVHELQHALKLCGIDKTIEL